ncbi:MAG: zeta toxin family protein [Methylacidiphilales bacterium]|nr:zeta toxin family protein [Candidatus Methylacidiphilales bacterium]
MALKPELVVIAGPNGSGKTTITRRVIQHAWGHGCLYLNPDEIAQREFGGWNSPEASFQAARKVAQIREEYLLSEKSLMFETVFSAPDKLEYIKKARTAGFFIRLFFICTGDPAINIRRIARRQEEGGHTVPTEKILSRYSKSIANCAIAVELVDRAYIYDNSVDNADPALLFRTENGALKKVCRQPVNDWAKPIFEKARRGAFEL